MRDSNENVSLLQKQINALQLENRILKKQPGSFWHEGQRRAKSTKKKTEPECA